MASRGMTLTAALKLTATQFNAGIKQVQRSLNSLKSTFLQVAGALGAGLGLSRLVSELRETATQLSIAKATLENVADNGAKYGEEMEKGVKDSAKAAQEYALNMAFLKRISNAYGQDLLQLTTAFAKFRAAAGYAGVSLEEIKRIYEALTKAAGAYHLTAEQTGYAMLAVEQMFSKGKVTAEELRRQLGNALPGAFGLMAKAAGMSTGEFEKAMKAGKILAADVLPKFADELNKITEGANFDSLQSSLNRFSNAWTQFTEQTGFEKWFKGLVDAGTQAFRTIGNNLQEIKQALISLAAGIAGMKIFSSLEKQGAAAVKNINKQYKVLENKNIQLTNQAAKLGKAYTDASNAAAGAANARFDVEGLTAAEAQAAGLNQGLVNIIANNEKMGKAVPSYNLKAADAMKVLSNRAGEVNKQIKNNEAAMQKFARQTQLAGTAGGRALIGLGNAAKAAGQAIKAALGAIVFGMLISLLTEVIQKLGDIILFSSRLKKNIKEIENDVKKIPDYIHTQIAEVKSLAKAAKDTEKSDEERLKYLGEINAALGLSGENALTLKSTAADIDTAIENWSTNLTKAAQRMAMLNKVGELTARNLELQSKIEDAESRRSWWNVGFINGEIERYKKEIAANNKLIEKFQAEANKLTQEVITNAASAVTTTTNDAGKTSPKDKLQKILDDYKEKVKELKNQLAAGSITTDEYYQELNKLVEKTWQGITAFDNMDAILQKLGGSYVDLAGTVRDSFEEMQMWGALDDYIKQQDKILEKEMDDFIDTLVKYNEKTAEIMAEGMPIREPVTEVNGRFAYKDGLDSSLRAYAKNAEEYVKALEKYKQKILELRKYGDLDPFMQKELERVVELLRQASIEAGALNDAADFAEVSEDIQRLRKDLEDAAWEEWSQGMLGASEKIWNAFKVIAENIGEDKDAWKDFFGEEAVETFERMYKILGGLSDIVKTVCDSFELFNNVVKISTKLTHAQEAATSILQGTQIAQGATQVATQIQAAAAEQAGAATTVAAEATKKTAIDATTSSLAAQGIAGAAASQAAIPVVGPLLAAGAVAGLVALLAANLHKFAQGGIVGGNNFKGDRNIARVNSGEMILNKAQQGTLWSMLNGKGSVGSNVEFKIRGADLIGAIKNTESRRSGGRF